MLHYTAAHLGITRACILVHLAHCVSLKCGVDVASAAAWHVSVVWVWLPLAPCECGVVVASAVAWRCTACVCIRTEHARVFDTGARRQL